MQFLVAVNQAVVSVQAFQLHAGRRQTKETNIAIHRAQHGVYSRAAKHAAEVVLVVFNLEFWV